MRYGVVWTFLSGEFSLDLEPILWRSGGALLPG